MPVPIPSRPQTLREAKKAFRKSSSTGISDLEKRRLKRASELEMRAERIKSKEKQRRINRQKKEEKERKEKDAKRKMGIPEEFDSDTIPGQARIASFLDRAPTKAADNEGRNILGSNKDLNTATEKKHLSRRPLQEISSNQNRYKAQELDIKSPPEKLPVMVFEEDDWLGLIASSTQIEREISYSSQADSVGPQDPMPAQVTAEKLETCKERNRVSSTAADQESIREPQSLSDFPLISTQDLEFTAEDLRELESPIINSNLETPGFSTEDIYFTDEDILDLDPDPSRISERPLSIPIPGPSVLVSKLAENKHQRVQSPMTTNQPSMTSAVLSASYDWSSDDNLSV